MMVDYNLLFKKYKLLIDKYVYAYGWLEGHDDFRQNLMIALWEYVEKMTITPQENPEKIFVGAVKYIALRVFYKYLKNKQCAFERSMVPLEADFFINNVGLSDIGIFDIINDEFNDNQKRIIYSLDYYGVGNMKTYKSIAEKIGINQSLMYSSLIKIRGILGEYIKNKRK